MTSTQVGKVFIWFMVIAVVGGLVVQVLSWIGSSTGDGSSQSFRDSKVPPRVNS